MSNTKKSVDNPLKGYFRQYDSWVTLPSKEMGIYPPEVAEVNEDGEIGVMPMTGSDEILLKNPDALYNGEAIRQVIKSCCPSVKNPDKLLLNDLEALIVAIRKASYGKVMDMEVTCPECKKKSTLGLDLEDALQYVEYLGKEYSVVITHGSGANKVDLRIHICPYRYESYLKIQKKTFEEEKIIRALQSRNVDEGEKITHISNAYQKIAQLSFNTVAESVLRITSEDDGDLDVDDADHIFEFMMNISRENAKKISNALDSIAELGVKKKFDMTCEHCEHEFEERVIYDPASFFS